MLRKPLIKTQEPSMPNSNEVEAKIREYEKILGKKRKVKALPKARDESAPGKYTDLA